MKKSVLFLFFLFSAVVLHAQWDWYNPLAANGSGVSFVHNQGWNEDGGNYRRLPLRAEGKVRKEVWNLSGESAGLAVRFVTDAENIRVRYQVTGGYSMPHMPSTGVSGVDLYRLPEDGRPEFCFGSYSFADTVSYAYHVDRGIKSAADVFVLYLPLYNGVKWLEIGVEEGKSLSFVPVSGKKRPIVLYGTSIAQGACASRPGMAWGNILSRSLDVPLVNLGLSGNGRLEKEVLDFINELEACVYILDCMANLSGSEAGNVKSLVKDAVRQLRGRHDAPILLVEHAGYSNGLTDRARHEAYMAPNAEQRKAFEELKEEGMENLFYLTHEELGLDPDSWVDYVHPSDWGMVQQAAAVEKVLRGILE